MSDQQLSSTGDRSLFHLACRPDVALDTDQTRTILQLVDNVDVIFVAWTRNNTHENGTKSGLQYQSSPAKLPGPRTYLSDGDQDDLKVTALHKDRAIPTENGPLCDLTFHNLAGGGQPLDGSCLSTWTWSTPAEHPPLDRAVSVRGAPFVPTERGGPWVNWLVKYQLPVPRPDRGLWKSRLPLALPLFDLSRDRHTLPRGLL